MRTYRVEVRDVCIDYENLCVGVHMFLCICSVYRLGCMCVWKQDVNLGVPLVSVHLILGDKFSQ